MSIYGDFIIRDGPEWIAMVAFVKQHAKACLKKGSHLRIIVTSEDKPRNSTQNKFYWGAILRDISEQAWIERKQYNKETWHEYLSRRFGISDEMTLPDGEIILHRKSTSHMSVGEFSTYLNQIQSYASNELKVCFE